MKSIRLDDQGNHNFEKTSLVTERGGFDYYKCTHCGQVGKRYLLNGTLSFDKDVTECTHKPAIKPFEKRKVRITRFTSPGMGINDGAEMDTVECPEQEKYRFGNEVWVMSEKRGEPVRLLKYEYEFIQ